MTTETGKDARVEKKFRAAWEVFARTCGEAVAPEATFQAWFAHYMISQFGIDRVAREPDFGIKEMHSPRAARFRGQSVMVDLVVTREPGVYLPRRALLDDRSGMKRLADLAVISELKVASTTGEGLDHGEVARDFWKLSLLLDEADRRGIPTPMAFVCVLDNHPTRRYRWDHLTDVRLVAEPADDRVIALFHSDPHLSTPTGEPT